MISDILAIAALVLLGVSVCAMGWGAGSGDGRFVIGGASGFVISFGLLYGAAAA